VIEKPFELSRLEELLTQVRETAGSADAP
jgi:hypothetical protein